MNYYRNGISCSQLRRTCAGFTMIELVIVMVIVGVLADVLSRLISAPMRSYIAQQRRGELVDNANIAIDRITLEAHLALPNSVRVTADNLNVEFLRTVDGGRYRTSLGNLGGDVLDFDSGADVTFDVIGQLGSCTALVTGTLATDCINGNAFCLVIGNTGLAGSDAYQGNNITTLQSCGNDTADDGSDKITFINTALPSGAFPVSPVSHRFQIVDTPVTFRCDLGTGQLKRYDGYAIAAAQPDPPTSTPSLLLENVTACSFTYNKLQDALIFRIETKKDGELVTLLQQIKINNDT